MRETFTLPNTEVLLTNHGELSDRIVVVSIIGKTSFNSHGLKLKSIGRMFSHNKSISNEHVTVEGYYEEENQIMYLHVRSLLDAESLLSKYDEIQEKYKKEFNNDDFLYIYDDVKSSFARALFLVLHISHIVVLSHPSSTFDTSYIQYFKTIENMGHIYHDQISNILSNISGISTEWACNWRPCTPRLIFYFENCPKNVTNLKKLEHNIEDHIYHILRKTRIISNNNANSLFSIPLNEEFVFISMEKRVDALGDAVRGLINGCQPGAAVKMYPPFSNQPNSNHSFPNFLHSHVQQARNKRFEETISSTRHNIPQTTHFELPPLKPWALASKELYTLIMENKPISILSTDMAFSDQRCLKVLPMAIARYQEGLPSHYSQMVHESRLNAAIALFAAQARGPVFQQYNEQLITDCQAYWEAGRQLCEVLSFTGNPCTLPKHLDSEHCSAVRYLAACDCGRKQSTRDDPYSVKQANYDFYHQLSKECVCSTLERIIFPSKSHNYEMEETEKENKKIDEMLTTFSPNDWLPDYSSWSLVCLGPSSLYSHNLGLSENHHPGFLNSTNYLLPWDVPVFSKNKTNNNQAKAIRGRRNTRTSTNIPLFTVKVFIGIEYECPSGHRFMLAGPDKVLRAAPGSIVKDTGRKIAESDMPLYFPCPCRTGKQRIAQLMRLHVVTPKAQVHVTLEPKIMHSTSAPIFIPTTAGPINLSQSTYWIMRLPYIYTCEQYFLDNNNARLLQGVFNVNKIE